MDARTLVRSLKTPVTLIILAVFVALVAQWALKAATAPVPPRPPEPCVMTNVGSQLTPERVTIRVYNGTETDGLAKRYAANLRADGFIRVVKIGNTPKPDVEKSHLVVNKADNPEAKLVKMAFKDIEVVEDGRVDHSVDVVIGKEFHGWSDHPGLSVPVTGEVCLPATNVPTINE